MTSECEPRLAICARMAACAPCPIASMAITAATPMITPSMVRAERIVFRRKARWAIRMAMRICVMDLPSKSARVAGVRVHLRVVASSHLRFRRHQLGLGGAQLGLGRLDIRLRGMVLGDGSVIGRLGGLDLAARQQARREQRLLPL